MLGRKIKQCRGKGEAELGYFNDVIREGFNAVTFEWSLKGSRSARARGTVEEHLRQRASPGAHRPGAGVSWCLQRPGRRAGAGGRAE